MGRAGKRRGGGSSQAKPAERWKPVPRAARYLFVFALGLAVGGITLTVVWPGRSPDSSSSSPSEIPGPPGTRTVAQIIALPDEQIERTDILEMSMAVAREIPGLENLQYPKYKRILDGWTDDFRRWLPPMEVAFHQAPQTYKNDINFFRLGMLAQFLDQEIGIAYVEEQKRAQVQGSRQGKVVEVRYTDPAHLLLHGLIDTKRGTCGTMPTLHVAMGRRLGWPVSLACVRSHYVCRYDDGNVVYNMEATDTGRGGFAEGSDKDYMEKEGISKRAVACGSDLRRLTAREMLGIFIAARARHFADTDRPHLAARDYALAHTLVPSNRNVYVGLVGHLLQTGERLFGPNEHGHPASLGVYLTGRYRPGIISESPMRSPGRYSDPFAEVERIDAINRANMRRMMQPPGVPAPGYPALPGHETRPGTAQPDRERPVQSRTRRVGSAPSARRRR